MFLKIYYSVFKILLLYLFILFFKNNKPINTINLSIRNFIIYKLLNIYINIKNN